MPAGPTTSSWSPTAPSRVFEHTAEDNNAAFAPVATIVSMAPPADLVVASVTVPASGMVGQTPSTPITWTVTNQGINTATGSWYDTVYLSADETWDIADPLVASVLHTGDLAPGASYIGSTNASLPAAIPGDYHVIVRTDIRNNVRESNDANNQGVSAATIAMDMPGIAFGVPVAGTSGRQPGRLLPHQRHGGPGHF